MILHRDFKYFVRCKLELLANIDRDKSPLVKSFQVDYTDPGSFPTAEFLAEQDKSTGYRRPVYKVVLYDSTNNQSIDITDRVIKGGISNLTHVIPTDPDKLADIIANRENEGFPVTSKDRIRIN